MKTLRLISPILVALTGAWLVFAAAPAAVAQSFQLTSRAYADGSTIPARFTCTGADLSPPLAWAGAPVGTKSFALIISDPDAPDPAAPKMTWIHWVLYDIPTEVYSLAAGASKALPAGTRLGRNSGGRADYDGPCPPVGRHHYVHTLYALDTVLPDLHHPDRDALKAAMRGHVLAKATLVATYKKPR